MEKLWVFRKAEASPISAQPYPPAAFLHLNEHVNGANPPLLAQLGQTVLENCQSHKKKKKKILGREEQTKEKNMRNCKHRRKIKPSPVW